MRLRIPGPAIAALVAGLTAVALTACGGGSKHSSSSTSTPSATPARQALPGGLVGVMFDGPVLASGFNLDQQLEAAVTSGVESLRVPINWSAAQPVRSFSQVPAALRPAFTNAGGVPTLFRPLDRIIGSAAARGLTLLPVVERTPKWDAQQPQ